MTISSSRWLAEALAGYGVTHVFFVPEVLTPALAEMGDVGIVRVSAHSELAAAYMADGYARAARRAGVCLAQAVGAMNLAAGLREPFLGGAPVIALTGGPEPRSRYRYLYQQVEDLPAFEPVTKANARVERPDRLPDMLRQAFRVATTGTPGPVHLEIPGRLAEALDPGEEAGPPHIEGRYSGIPPHRPVAEAAAVARAARLLEAAERPVIVAGGGVAASTAGPELVRLAEALGIPVASSLNGKGSIPENHPLAIGLIGSYGRWSANETVAEADLVFFVGSRAGGLTTDNWKAPRPGATTIQLDIEPAELGRNYPAVVELLGDARTTLEALLGEIRPRPVRGPWIAAVQARTAAWRAAVAPHAASDAAPIRPERLCREVTDWLPSTGVVVADTGHIAQWSGSLVELRSPDQRFIRCAGTLGWGIPGAIGVKCALPDRTVVCLTGDGGFYYHLAELETAVRQGIEIIVVVNDNAALSQTRADYAAAHGDRAYPATELWKYRDVDLAAIATDLGCHAVRVHDPARLPAALREAQAAGRPAVIDVVSDPDALPLRPWRSA